MAKRSKSLIHKAREDKARRARLEHERLTVAISEAETEEEREAANLALREYYQEQEAEVEKKNQ